jgi:hypothetical protein
MAYFKQAQKQLVFPLAQNPYRLNPKDISLMSSSVSHLSCFPRKSKMENERRIKTRHCFGHLHLRFGYCLYSGACNLEFNPQNCHIQILNSLNLPAMANPHC